LVPATPEEKDRKQVDSGPLKAIARNKVNLDKVITHWPDMLWVAGSLITNQVRAYDLLRVFGRAGRMSPLGRRSPSTGASTTPCTCSPCATPWTTPTGGG
jgi:hypothetical protein